MWADIIIYTMKAIKECLGDYEWSNPATTDSKVMDDALDKAKGLLSKESLKI